jgi:hypothetical protein
MSRRNTVPIRVTKQKCRKTRFEDEFHARKVGTKHEMRAYHCTRCGGWHLTSQEHR